MIPCALISSILFWGGNLFCMSQGAGWIPEEVVGFVSGRVLDGLV